MLAQDCARTYRANAILTASPAQLVLVLYDGALGSIAAARQAFDLPARDLSRFSIINRNLNKAHKILGHLQSNLDFKAGEEFAQMMYRLYDYYRRRLLEANVRKDVQPLIEVERLLTEVRDAWATMLRQQGSPVGEPETFSARSA
jgi:flagellar protein FliS